MPFFVQRGKPKANKTAGLRGMGAAQRDGTGGCEGFGKREEKVVAPVVGMGKVGIWAKWFEGSGLG